MAFPAWWSWPLELTPHLEERMFDRDFTEVDLRTMLQRARSVSPSAVESRFMVDVRHRRRPWVVIVEPDRARRRVLVITAYAKESS
ncbi:MAG TPA: DUF4258 domain-containing protein [Polyangiaceae bacterium]|jgi:hypothetical protein|nr:DUF4258 domain-containing protein [Polyangiaceae bacterium]